MTITTPQLRAIELIVQGLNMESIAEKVGVTTRTLCNWKKNHAFATELRDQLTHMRDQIQARFNPMIARIQKNSETFFERLEKMLASADDKIALRAMQLHLQCLKWAGNSENQSRGSYIANDAIVGSARYGSMLSSLGLARFAPQSEDEEEETGSCGRDARATCTAGVSPATPARSAGVSPAIESEENGNASAPEEEGRRDARGTTAVCSAGVSPACETGNNRNSEPMPAAPQNVEPEEIIPAKFVAPPANSAPEPEKIGTTKPGASTPISKKPAPSAAWWEKGKKSSNHVPFYKRIHR